MPHGTCHLCGRPIKLRPATAAETEAHGYEPEHAAEYLFGRCYRTFYPTGERAHYGHPAIVIHETEAE
jgi:hypothetical protein